MTTTVRTAPGARCTEGHDRTQGHTSYNTALAAAGGDDSRVTPCFDCEKYFISE